jgi:hypothetical protein
VDKFYDLEENDLDDVIAESNSENKKEMKK